MNEYIGYIASAIASGIGCGSLTWLFTLRSTKKQAEANAMASVQNVYQELMGDLKKDRDELRNENRSLKDENRQFREELTSLHERQDKLESQCQKNTRDMEAMRPWLCYSKDCPNRINTAKK